ncbi:hypothetical protein CFC21_066473 [Triticum aestivum]|uniref:CCAAT-binding factor domain-containing protein n=2 Tax=Triticum aestivum TaxID=4565 RepID=A0A9R1H5M9_WHEAT|nr:hypothetical protein CFC21_066473 [Triticum aestivum]
MVVARENAVCNSPSTAVAAPPCGHGCSTGALVLPAFGLSPVAAKREERRRKGERGRRKKGTCCCRDRGRVGGSGEVGKGTEIGGRDLHGIGAGRRRDPKDEDEGQQRARLRGKEGIGRKKKVGEDKGPLRAHARLRFKQRAPADDGAAAKEACPRDPADKEGVAETDPYAKLWPWGDYFPDEDELRREDFATMQERFSRESTEAVAALKAMIAGVFRPLLDNFHHLRSLKTVYDTEDYHIGMPFGALVACVGCYQLWKMDPSMFVSTALGYAFYKLSVVSLELRKQGFANDLITRLKFVIMLLIMAVTYNKKYSPLDAIMAPVFMLYSLTFACEVTGVKKQFKYAVPLLNIMLRHPEGRRELRAMLSEVELELVSECGIVVL